MSFFRSVPRAFVRDCLVDREVEPLPLTSRAFIQQKFGGNVGEVRIHRGPAASRLCTLLQARALVVNRDIVFAEGQYEPHTLAGQRILAHEIIHLLQQRNSKPPETEFMPIGDPHDPYEVEAARLTEEALRGNLRSVPTADLSGAIRRVFTLLPNASMEADYKGAIPGVTYTKRGSQDFAVFHLTRRSAPIIAGTARKPADASAIRITASVGVLSDNLKDDLTTSNVEFHFVQFFGLTDHRAFYAGPEASGGNMFLDFASLPAYIGADDLMLDTESKSNIFPFYDMNPPEIRRASPTMWLVKATMDDHPFNDLPLRLPNFVSSKLNFLCTAYKRFNVVTAFVLRDLRDLSKPTTTILSEMFWGAEVACRFRWTQTADGDISVGPPEFTIRDFHCGNAIKDPDPDLTTRIRNLSGSSDTYNDAASAAYKSVIGSTFISRNMQASGTWYSKKIADFFK
jgi:hypothetical protein